MFDYLHLFLIFTLPVLLFPLKTFHRGLITGLFLSLLYWGSLFPIVILVPVSAAVFLLFYSEKQPAEANADFYVRKPSQRLFAAFLIFMVIFCAFGDAVFQYGIYIKASGTALRASSLAGTFGLLCGPVITGFWSDKRGTFQTAVSLTLFAEIGIAFAAFGGEKPYLWTIGWFIQQVVVSGFLTLIPLISLTLFGDSHFSKIYPQMAILLMLTWTGAEYLFSKSPSFSQNPGDLLMTLVFLPLFSVFFIVIAWQRRFVLVTLPK